MDEMDEYQRAETPAHLVEIIKEYFPDEPRISEELAAEHLDEFNEGMEALVPRPEIRWAVPLLIKKL